MGQYGNQPDFGTRATLATPLGTPYDSLQDLVNLKSAALYIGTGGTLVCKVVGGNAYSISSVPGGYTIFKNIPDGTFFPVVLDYVFITDDDNTFTTCSDIVALY